jgi:hypothetical protein
LRQRLFELISFFKALRQEMQIQNASSRKMLVMAKNVARSDKALKHLTLPNKLKG